MKDRLYFKKTKLKNGIDVYTHHMDTSFFDIRVILPVGNVHSHSGNNAGEGGIAHFIEHLIFGKSKLYPEKNSFERKLASWGGAFGGATHPWCTEIQLSGNCKYVEEIITGLIDHIYNPIYNESDIEIERNVIANERTERKYYPGYSSLGHYMYNEWMDDTGYTKDQLFGSDEDLASITKEKIEQFHKYYFSNETKILIGGTFDEKIVIDLFSKIHTVSTPLTPKIDDIKWVKKDNSFFVDKDADSHQWIIGGLKQGGITVQQNIELEILTKMLLNTKQGRIYDWLRKEKGWVYGIDSGSSKDADRFVWYCIFSFNSKQSMLDARKEFDQRVSKAIRDTDFVKNEIQRQKAESIFYYQTLGERMDIATESIMSHGDIVSEKQFDVFLENCTDSDYLLEIYNNFFTEKIRGEFFAIPDGSDLKG